MKKWQQAAKRAFDRQGWITTTFIVLFYFFRAQRIREKGEGAAAA